MVSGIQLSSICEIKLNPRLTMAILDDKDHISLTKSHLINCEFKRKKKNLKIYFIIEFI